MLVAVYDGYLKRKTVRKRCFAIWLCCPKSFLCFLSFLDLISILESSTRADVAELVDAQVSEACGREAVEVRFFSSAPLN